MREKLGILGKKWVHNIVKTMPDHRLPWNPCFIKPPLKLHSFKKVLTPFDTDFQRESNNCIFIQNESEMSTVVIFWISQINFICFILKHRISPAGQEFPKGLYWVCTIQVLEFPLFLWRIWTLWEMSSACNWGLRQLVCGAFRRVIAWNSHNLAMDARGYKLQSYRGAPSILLGRHCFT